jgi:acyl-CoA synthetase (AMP-forming)/AMP-acid ligase II
MDYLSIDSCHMGIEWRTVAGDDKQDESSLYEPVIVRSKDQQEAGCQAVFQTFPSTNEYALGDLWVPHSTKAHTWKFQGRTDDLIAFAHGVKFHPAGIEGKIQQGHPWIREVLMCGNRHYQAILLIELTPAGMEALDSKDGAATLEAKLGELIEEVNKTAPKIAQLSKKHVVLVSKEKPLPRTEKGSVKRRAVAELYEPEMEAIYIEQGDELATILTRVK